MLKQLADFTNLGVLYNSDLAFFCIENRYIIVAVYYILNNQSTYKNEMPVDTCLIVAGNWTFIRHMPIHNWYVDRCVFDSWCSIGYLSAHAGS